MRKELVLVFIIVLAALAVWFLGRPKDEIVPPKCPPICAYGCTPGTTTCRPPPPPSCPSNCTIGCINGTSQCIEIPKQEPIIQCSAVDENSKLSMSINSEDTCLSIEKDDVTLDCRGYSITGRMKQNSYAIYINGRKNITIRNCVLRNYGTGIAIDSSSDISLSDIRTEDNDIGILVNLSSSVLLYKITVSKNAAAGAILVSSNNVEFSNNYVSDSPEGVIIESSNITRFFNNNICSSISALTCSYTEIMNEGQNICDNTHNLGCGIDCLSCEEPPLGNITNNESNGEVV